ncbi:MAG TPA: glycoside hydrolase family 18 protein [Pirellulales bacterium]|jgi:GH18 family chitinase|nr:glycoside hydrolase family 18 protein [Pirellulales bacterium]
MDPHPRALPLACLFAALFTTGLAADEKRTFHIVGYLPEYRLSAFDLEKARDVTDLVYFSVEPTAEGDFTRDHVRGDALAKLQAIKAKHGLNLSLSVGGWGRSTRFPQVTASEKVRQAFVGKLVQFCREHQFDGIDLDWEHPSGEAERENYGRLLVELKKEGLLVTVAIADWQGLSPAGIEAVDRVHLMAYDAPKQHSTYEYAVSAVERLIKMGVPADKICLGVPFYGRGVEQRAKSLTYRQIVEKHDPAPTSDEVDGIYFNGLETIRRKTRLAVEKKLGGVMIWELGQDTQDERSLLRAIHRAASDRP